MGRKEESSAFGLGWSGKGLKIIRRLHCVGGQPQNQPLCSLSVFPEHQVNNHTFVGGTGVKAEVEVRWWGHNESEEAFDGQGVTTCMNKVSWG